MKKNDMEKERGLACGVLRFSLGTAVMTRGCSKVLNEQEIFTALARHQQADWGMVSSEDWRANDEALETEGRLVSSYDSDKGVRFWVITEWDRSLTTVLLPEEY